MGISVVYCFKFSIFASATTIDHSGKYVGYDLFSKKQDGISHEHPSRKNLVSNPSIYYKLNPNYYTIKRI
jgi:hypothetical protein